MIKQEIKIFFSALMFFTRIPVPKRIEFSQENLSKSSRYFPLIGIIVGGTGALVYCACSLIFPHAVAILLSMVTTIMVTGAFHEDGLSDMCDGFGGGWTKHDILRIMKDSRVGTFGVIGLCSVLALKFASLYNTSSQLIPLVLIAGHALSRFAASTLLFTLDYVRDDSDSKAKPAAQKMSTVSLVIAAFFGVAPLFLFSNYYVFLALIPVFAITWYLKGFYARWIGGQTGDCSGATQQLCEVVFYLSFIVQLKIMN